MWYWQVSTLAAGRKKNRYCVPELIKFISISTLMVLVSVARLYAGTDGRLHSWTWEREASLAAVERYNAFCRNNASMLKKNREVFPVKKSGLPENVKQLYGHDEFIVFQRSANDKIYKSAAPGLSEIISGGLALDCAKNEWESIQIGIWALKDLKKFSYGVTDLVHKNNTDRIKAGGPHIRPYFVYNILARKDAPSEVTKDMDIDPAGRKKSKAFIYEEEPAVLLDLPGIDIQADTAQGLWLDLKIDADTQAGKYHGAICFKIKNREVLRMPLNLEVYPFELDRADDWARGAYISKFIDEKEAVNLFENGHNQVSWWTTGGYRIRLKDEIIFADFTPFAEYLEMLDRAGLKGPHVCFLGGDSPKLHNKLFSLLGREGISNGRNVKYRQQYKRSDISPPFESCLIRTLKQFHAQMKACGHGNMPVVLLDEPDHRPRPDRMEWYNKTYQMVEKGIPDLTTMGVFYHKGDEKKLSNHHSVWSTNRPSLVLYNACKAAGKKLYTYHGGYKFYDRPGKFRFSVGIIPWVYEAAGTFYWAIWNHSGNKRHLDDIFSPSVFSGQSTTLAMAPLNGQYGPLSTLIHKGFREAVDDARYIKTLEKKIKESMGTSRQEKALGHERWLKDLQVKLRKRLYIRGGHVANHKNLAGGKPPLSWMKVKNMQGRKTSLENLEEFTEFVRKDVTLRILDLM